MTKGEYPKSSSSKKAPDQTPSQIAMPEDPMKVMFPEEAVELPNGDIVHVRPLSLKDLPKVAEAFSKLMQRADLGATPAELASSAFAELSKIVPYCIDYPVEAIPATFAPEILELVITQNITKEVVGKWTTLMSKVAEVSGTDLSKLTGKISSAKT
jgi:hypothetical protein